MTTIVVSAPGKVIVHGEHAVVFGKRALAGSLGLRSELHLTLTKSDRIIVDFPDINIQAEWKCDHIATALRLPLCDASSPPLEVSTDILPKLRELGGINSDSDDPRHLAIIAFLFLYCSIAPVDRVLPGIHAIVSSSLPTGAGLGSSAAFSVCLSAGLLVGCRKIHRRSSSSGSDGGDGSKENFDMVLTDLDLELINRWAFTAEKIIHGRPSGIDNTVGTFGGALCFKNGKMEPLMVMPKFRVLLINTRVARSTKLLVEKVRRKHEAYPDIISFILDSIEAITTRCEATFAGLSIAIAAGDESTEQFYRTLEELIDMNHHLLNLLGVGHSSLDIVQSVTTKYGLHAKLTGAGGGGCAFALIPPYVTDDAVAAASHELASAGFDCFETSLGGPGVTVHFTAAPSNVKPTISSTTTVTL